MELPPPPALAAQTVASTGTHVNEGVVATAANPSVPNHFATSFPTVQTGSDGNNVKALTYLLLGNGLSAPVTTSYTTAVSNAVKSYQSGHGLPATGIADPTTLAALSTQLTAGTTSARTQAAAVLLNKHGYNAKLSTTSVKNLDLATMTFVKAFQAGHGITQSSYVGNHTWATLFSDKTSGPIYPLMQYQTGGASQWNNCGPASASMITLYLNKNLPYWTGSADTRNAAVSYMRYTLIGVPKTAYNDAHVGTTPSNLIPAFAKLGINSFSGDTSAVISAAKAGHPSIAGGDGYKLYWNQNGSDSFIHGSASHYIAVLGWDGTNFIVGEPISTPDHNVVHTLSEAQLRNFGSTAPGWGPNVPGNDVPPSKNNIITR